MSAVAPARYRVSVAVRESDGRRGVRVVAVLAHNPTIAGRMALRHLKRDGIADGDLIDVVPAPAAG